MKRRKATVALILLAVVPFGSAAQPTGKSHRIGFLGLSSASEYAPLLSTFLQGLRELGYEEGRNIVIEYRWANGREERLPELAAQLVRLNPEVIVSHSIGVSAAQKATPTIPIVMGVSADPVGTGLIKTLAKPGGNTTGVASQLTDLAPKRLELLKEAIPKLKAVAILSNPALLAHRKGLEETKLAARKLGVRVRSFDVMPDPPALESMFTAILSERPDALVVQPDPFTAWHVAIAAFAVKNKLPSIGGARQFVLDGGLVSYAGSFIEGWRLAARYVDKVLKGANPGELPVEQPRTFELAINQKTATALGLILPRPLLLRANEGNE